MISSLDVAVLDARLASLEVGRDSSQFRTQSFQLAVGRFGLSGLALRFRRAIRDTFAQFPTNSSDPFLDYSSALNHVLKTIPLIGDAFAYRAKTWAPIAIYFSVGKFERADGPLSVLQIFGLDTPSPLLVSVQYCLRCRHHLHLPSPNSPDNRPGPDTRLDPSKFSQNRSA